MFYKIIRTYWFVLIIPLTVGIISLLLRSAVGPFWQHADPSYIYLLNSLNMVKGIPSAFFDQPGFTIQILGQIVIIILNLGQSTASTIQNVLTNPELYLNVINLTLLFLIFLSSILLGAYTYRKTNDILATLLSQLPNLLLMTFKSHTYHHPVVPLVFSNINAEPLLLCITNLFNIFVLKLYFSKTKKEENFAILSLALISGLGISTKLTFIPLLAFPIIISRWKLKPVFLISVVVSFILWTIPFIPLYHALWDWARELSTHTGIYGNGSQGIIDTHEYLGVWALYFKKFWFFIIFILSAITFSSFNVFKNQKNRADLFILAISFTALIQLAVIAKHFDEHYLVVVIDSLGPLFVLFYLNQSTINKTILKRITCSFIAIASLYSAVVTSAYALDLAEFSKEVIGFNSMIHAKYPNSIFIGSYLELPLRNSEYALFMGNDSSGGGENAELTQLYPKNFTFYADSRDISGTCTNGLYHFNQSILADDLLAQFPYTNIIFVNSGYDFSLSPYIVKPLENGKYSKAYLLLGSTEKSANLFFNTALQLIQKGDYPQAFAFALKSHELHYQPKEKVEYLLSILYSHLKHDEK